MLRRTLQITSLALFAFLFFYVCCPYPSEPGREQEGFPSHYADRLAEKESFLQAETFLWLDPSAAVVSAIAGRFLHPGFLAALVVVIACLVIPRGFCGYVCPLGTMLDFFDALLSPIRKIFRQRKPVSYSSLQPVILAVLVVWAVFGVSLAGYFAPIPVLTRFFVIVLSPFQTAFYRGWYQVPALNAGEVLSAALFFGIVFLGLIHRRFWCRNLCPTGALLSIVSHLRLFGKKVDPQKCNHCAQCVTACSFGAIDRKQETASSTACTTCLTCKTVCKNQAISFGSRAVQKVGDLPPGGRVGDSRLNPGERSKSAIADLPPGTSAATFNWSAATFNWSAATFNWSAATFDRRGFFWGGLFLSLFGLYSFSRPKALSTPIRPPGSIPEMDFLQRCVRCGECLRACPNNALQPISLDWNGGGQLWTPQLVPDWSGCEPSCNNCGVVCPTSAIRALPLLEKRACRIGLAVIDRNTCLPLAGKEECQLCYDECQTAGYDAIEFMRVGTEVDESGMPIEGSGFLAPVILPDKCVGCGLCQTRCRVINVVQKRLFEQSAIQISAGEGREDRLLEGSYRDLRKLEQEQKSSVPLEGTNGADDYLPDFLL